MTSPAAHQERVATYYDRTWKDYKTIWLSADNLALHYGYWDESTSDLADALMKMNHVLAERIGISRDGLRGLGGSGLGGRLRILDAGCGVGGSSLWLCEEFDAEVVGVTLSTTQVERARGFAKERGLSDRVSFAMLDFCDTRLESGSFDVVWGLEAVCHALDKRDFMIEAHRLLRPGGRLGIADYFRHARPYPTRDERFLLSFLEKWSIPDLDTRGEFEDSARWAGFHDVRMDDITEHVRPSNRRLHRYSVAFMPVMATMCGLRRWSRWHLDNARGGRMQWLALKRRLWFEGLLTATASPPDRLADAETVRKIGSDVA